MPIAIFSNVTEKQKTDATVRLMEASTPGQDFYLMTMLAVLMAAMGIMLDSIAVVIGSMLIAPILYSVLALALGIIVADGGVIARSFLSLLRATVFGVAASAIAGLVLKAVTPSAMPLLFEMVPSMLYLLVSIVAGVAASMSLIKPKLNEMIVGVAISVALIPPLAATGLALSLFEWTIASNAIVLFLLNTIGIVFASMIVFSLFKLAKKKTVASKAAQKEDAFEAAAVKKAAKAAQR